MHPLSDIYIRETLADSPLIHDRGRQTWKNGSYFISHKDLEKKAFVFQFDGRYGNYTTRIEIKEDRIQSQCSCPYPGQGCRHVVAAVLNARSLIVAPRVQEELFPSEHAPFLSAQEIQDQALKDRQERAQTDAMTPVRGDMFTGDHKVISKEGRTYTVCLHDPAKALGHCSCPDYQTNGLGTCKHILFMASFLWAEPGFAAQAATESLPFVDIFWDSLAQAPRLHAGDVRPDTEDLKPVLAKYFDDKGRYVAADLSLVMGLMLRLHGDPRVRIRQNLLRRVEHRQQQLQLEKMQGRPLPKIPLIRPLYPFQEEAVALGVLRTGVLLGDEIGLGKTVQALGLSLMKKKIFGFTRILVITLISLKPLWKREVEAASKETATIVQGSPARREALFQDKETFKITHYETIIRDRDAILAFNPDIIILDEAQRIRNLSTKTAEAVKRLPRKHAIVLTGTPLENRPEDLYSVVQFLDPYLFTPLWRFAADHFNIPRGQKVRDRQTQTAGYKNLDRLREKLKGILIRRSWEEVEDQLPDQVVNDYYIDLAPEQARRHTVYAARLAELLRKPSLSPMDLRQIQTLVLRMRMVSNSTFLVDRETQISPKLRELAAILDEVVVLNRRKTVIFSEWTAMTFLMARHLTETDIPFAQVSGKMDEADRRAMADKFSQDPDCLVFLATDAGSTGLDLSAALCLIHLELPWPPTQAALRMEKVRPAQNHDRPTCHIINLIGAGSVEERIKAAQDLDLLSEIFDPDPDRLETLCQSPQEVAQGLTRFLGTELLPQALPQEIPDEHEFFAFPEAMAQSAQESKTPSFPAAPLFEDNLPGTAPDTLKPALPLAKDRLEAVLHSGLDFMAGLVAIATGTPAGRIEEKEVQVDPDSGRITLRFKLPPNPQ